MIIIIIIMIIKFYTIVSSFLCKISSVRISLDNNKKTMRITSHAFGMIETKSLTKIRS